MIYIRGIEVRTKYGIGIILDIYEFDNGEVALKVQGNGWCDWIYEGDIVEAGE